MKTNQILLATAALVLLGPSIASAQDQGDQGRHGRDAQGRPPPAAQPQAAAPARGQAGGRPDWNAYMRNNPDLQKDYAHNQAGRGYTETPQAYAERHYREHGQAEGRAVPQQQAGPAQSNGQRPGDQGGQLRGGGDARPGDRNGRDDHSGQAGNRDWRGDRGHQDWRSDNRFRNYERNVDAQRHFHFGHYERPRGWYPRRWAFGEFLPSVFWSSNYWINDFSAFGLPYPPPGCTWVRYGDDALLIDRYTGEIVQVIYGIFY